MAVVSVDVKPINSLFRVYSRCSDTWSLLMAPPPRKAMAGPSMTMDDRRPAQWTQLPDIQHVLNSLDC